MTLKSWFYLFWTTMVVGTAASLAAGLMLVALFSDFALMELSEPGLNWQTLLFIVLSGSSISVLSHMGFFSYLIVRYIALGVLRSKRLWDWLQAIFIVVVFMDFIYLRYVSFAAQGESWVPYSALPTVFLAASFLVGLWKARLTSKHAFIPTFFFMYVVTVLEAIPALRIEGVSSSIYMLIPLFASNAWQILILHKVLQNKRELAS